MADDTRVQIQIRLDTATIARLHTEAEARIVSVNWLISRLITEGLNNLIPVPTTTLRTED